VGRSILTGVVTLGAVVAKVRKVVDIRLAERQPTFHCRENSAVAFAITAGIADDHQTFAFRD